MNEHPILFSGPMVRAILKGRKTQTRRVIQPKPDHFHTFQPGIWLPQIGDKEIKCSYGEPGDRLWVRETWLQDGGIYLYKADFGMGVLSDSWSGHWKPSIHMPRAACRITLEIVRIRAERLQDISEEDSRAEGLATWRRNGETQTYYGIDRSDIWETDSRLTFKRLWDSINASRGYGWNVNPWVWVIEFKKVHP